MFVLDQYKTQTQYHRGGEHSRTMLPVIEIMLPGAPVQSQIGGNVPAFLAKLWKMVDNPDTGT